MTQRIHAIATPLANAYPQPHNHPGFTLNLPLAGWGGGRAVLRTIPGTTPSMATDLWPAFDGDEPRALPDIPLAPSTAPTRPIQELAADLTPGMRMFASLIAKGLDRTVAYQQAYPNAKSVKHAQREGRRLLTLGPVTSYIHALRNAVKDLGEYQDADLKRGVARIAFADLRRIFDGEGRLLAPALWPDDLAFAIQEIHEDVVYNGRGTSGAVLKRRVKLGPRLEALRTLAQMDGTLQPASERGGNERKATFSFTINGRKVKTISGTAKRVQQTDNDE